MKMVFHQKRIAGIYCIVPSTESYFEDEVHQYSFPIKQTLRLQSVMGYNKHRIVKPETSSFDLSSIGVESLLNKGSIVKQDIGAIIVVTITPDYFVPHVSNQIQGAFGFSKETICIDILQGCNGFLLGLLESFMLLSHMPNKKILLINVDVLSKKVSRQDRNSFPIIGDCAAITLLENDIEGRDIYIDIFADGGLGDALMIPAGGSRLPCSDKTAVMKDAGDGNIRCLDNLVMDGTAVFQYVMHSVPELIDDIFSYSGENRDLMDWFLFHQPNRFMLQKLADKIHVPREKMFMNLVENFGNPSGASIPLTAVFNLGNKLCQKQYRCCLSAFGGGLNCSAMIADIGNMDFCEMGIADV